VKDSDFEMLRRDLDSIWRRVKHEIYDNLVGTQPSRETLIDLALKERELTVAMEQLDGGFFREYYLRSMISDKAGPPAGRKNLTQLDLFEIFDLHHPGQEPTPKQRHALTRADMEQIGRQKQGNITAAVHAKQLWDWECRIIFPVFDEHPGWIYRQCYEVVCAENGGGFPAPPKL
jgi:hypothetical protein